MGVIDPAHALVGSEGAEVRHGDHEHHTNQCYRETQVNSSLSRHASARSNVLLMTCIRRRRFSGQHAIRPPGSRRYMVGGEPGATIEVYARERSARIALRSERGRCDGGHGLGSLRENGDVCCTPTSAHSCVGSTHACVLPLSLAGDSPSFSATIALFVVQCGGGPLVEAVGLSIFGGICQGRRSGPKAMMPRAYSLESGTVTYASHRPGLLEAAQVCCSTADSL
jgi:hypothetical protein